MLEPLHFLRPLWLTTLLPTVLVYAVHRTQLDPVRQWRRWIAPNLLEHLKVGAEGGMRFRPLHLVLAVLTLGAIGLAGPTWERETSPFAEDTAPLVIALDLSQSMNAIDVQPTRLERAKQKIRDLLAARSGARTALIVYAGTAHTVLPLSNDATIFETFLSSLSTDVMPVPGKDPSQALSQAEEILARDSVPGSILFLTDGIAEEYVEGFAVHRQQGRDEVMVLAVGTQQGGPIRTADNRFATDARGRRIVATLDRAGLEALARRAGIFVASVTVDDADVNRVQRRVQSHLQRVQQEDSTARWRDMGYYFVYPILLLAALWFRKGWTVRWAVVVLALGNTGCSPNLWLTPDQQAWREFDRGNYADAAALFEDPLWKGVAYYRAGDFENAITQFARADAPETYFNTGNAFASLGDYEQAVINYDVALESRPDWIDARENRDLVQALIELQAEEEPPGGDAPPGPPSFDPDEIQFDERGERGERGEVDMEQLSADQLAEMWMRRLQTSPAQFLRSRFAAEAAQRANGRER
jgi:Ca-activated chloride channel family protein